ncbi:protein kinase family protein [Alicyclobacillus sp. ALC3]|uniref:protein kinase family protein n=1 Tax=Alicyclobacillus sp. ALC3 TaxID=2796143 RepID=UPI00237862C5|nr:protein kinase family protein [Alicyclobacillus sp. ALC3]
MSYPNRLDRYANVSTNLALLSNQRLRESVESASILGTGIGGTSAIMQLEATSIFAKIIPLTELEKRTENVMSTRNVFDLPPYCHYGIGSPPGGVWREVVAQTMTTNWVLAGQCEGFPMMYHWRVLPNLRMPLSEELSDISRMVAFWDSDAVGNRIEASEQSVDSVVLFCEYIPHNLHDWMNEQVAMGAKEANSAITMVESQVRSTVSFMNSQGLLHFDAHFENILTDGSRIYITDFGLVTSSRFELSDSERAFVELNKTHDECYVVTHLVNWLVAGLLGLMDRNDRIDFIRRCASGYDPAEEVGSVAADIINRYAPIATVINDFYTGLRMDSKTTPFPVEEIQRVSAEIGFDRYSSDPSI